MLVLGKFTNSHVASRFPDSSAFWVYLYGPMLVLLLLNAIFFVGCIVSLSCGRGRNNYVLNAAPEQICRCVGAPRGVSRISVAE